MVSTGHLTGASAALSASRDELAVKFLHLQRGRRVPEGGFEREQICCTFDAHFLKTFWKVMAASAHGTRSNASPPPPASRWWLSRRERKDIRRAVNDFRHDDDVYSVSRHGTTVVLMRHRNEHHKSQAPPQQPAGIQRQQKKVQTQGNQKQPGNRQQKKAERSASRAKQWHAAQALQRNTGIISATMQQQQPGNQVLLQPPQAEPTSTKRSCSTTATPTKAGEGSETTGGMGAPQSQAISAARVRENAQRVRVHSPGGGPATGLLQRPSV